MTSDAKVGLLLGLVFIFIIAFVINGLPRFRSAVKEANATPAMVPEEESLSIAGKERKVLDTINHRSSETTSATEEAATTVPGNDTVQPSSNIKTNNEPETTREEQPELSQPKSSNNISPDSVLLTIPLQRNPFEGQWYSSRSNLNNNTVNTAENSQAKEPAAASQQNVQPAQQQQKKQTNLDSTQFKTYVVKDGETLSSIAKEVYGQVEGNKLVTIKQLYEANSDILKSVDSVVSGQTIVIPNIPVSTTPSLPAQSSTKSGSTTPVSKTPGSQIPNAANKTQTEKTPSGTQSDKAKPAVSTTSDTGRWYEVKSDDYIWKIAYEQLGKGSRYIEIIKLNADQLTEKNNYMVHPGMRLRLPAK